MAKAKNPIVTILEQYLLNPDKCVFPFLIKEETKERTIITYNEGKEYGKALRDAHEKVAAWFSDNFADRDPNSYAYQKGVRCSDALKPHLHSNYFIKLDIHHFFESITEEAFFSHYGEFFNKRSALYIKGCFYKGSLSIGYVTSPMLSDFFMKRFDKNVGDFLESHPELHYSRYSDDILLSSEEDDDDSSLNELFEFVQKELAVMGLEINPKKTVKRKLDFASHNSLVYLGLALSKADEFENKITISKRYILFLLKLIAKTNKYGDKCKGLLDEINSRVAYLAYNSPVSFARFQKKHRNLYGKEYNFVPKQPLDRTTPIVASEIPNYEQYAQIFDIALHAKINAANPYGFSKKDAIVIRRYLVKDQKKVVIPAFVDSIGPRAFFFHQEIEEVVFEGKIKHIDSFAFSGCRNLKKIVFPDSLRYIGDGAFQDTRSLKEIDISRRVKMISSSAFKGSGIRRAGLPDSLALVKNEAFADCRHLEAISLPDSLQSVGEEAFSSCTHLAEIALPSHLLSLERGVLQNCQRLKRIDLPSSLLEINGSALSGCRLLRELSIPDNVVNIAANAFLGIPHLSLKIKGNRVFGLTEKGDLIEKESNKLIVSLTKLPVPGLAVVGERAYEESTFERFIVPEGVESIEKGAFKGNEYLKEIVLPSSLKHLGPEVFEGCTSLKEAVVPEGITLIDAAAFKGCLSLERVTLPSSLLEIGKEAFAGDHKLSLELPKSLKKIGYKAFKDCTSLKKLYVGKELIDINDKAFYGCSSSLESIEVEPRNPIYASHNANVLSRIKEHTLILGTNFSKVPPGTVRIEPYAFYGCESIKEVKLPAATTHIGKGAFRGCVSLEKIDLKTVYSIGDSAFCGTKSLMEAKLPESLTELGEDAFANSGIKKLRLPNSLSNDIKDSTFQNCISLEEIHFSASIHKISRKMFTGLPNLKKITVDPANSKYTDLGSNGVFEEGPGKGYSLVLGCENTVLSEDIKTIQESAFSYTSLRKVSVSYPLELSKGCFAYCGELEEAELTDLVPSLPGLYQTLELPANAFAGCRKLKRVALSKEIRVIARRAFDGCAKLSEIHLPKELTSIKSFAFRGCASLKEIVVPKGVISIESGAFSGCKNLEKVVFEGPIENIGDDAFGDCVSLKEIAFPDSLVMIGRGAFKNCQALKAIAIPDNANPEVNVMIRDMAFAECSGLTDISLPLRLERIPTAAFRGCTSLRKLDLRGLDSLKSIGQYAFCGDDGLSQVFLPEKLEKIESHAFAHCPFLREVHLPDCLKSLGAGAFAYDPLIEHIRIPSSLISFHNSAFYGDPIKDITVEQGNPAFREGKSSTLIIKRYDDEIGPALLLAAKDPVIPEDVELIESHAFANLGDLEEVKLPKGLKIINSYAFIHCDKLTKVNLGDTALTKIGDNAFGSSNLEEVKLPNTLKTLEAHAFFSCKKLKEISLPASLEEYEVEAFSPSEALTSIKVDPANERYGDLGSNLIVDKESQDVLLSCKNSSFPEGIASIRVFRDAAKEMKEVRLPSTLDNAPLSFGNGMDIKKIEVHQDNPTFKTNPEGTALLTADDQLVYYNKDGIIPEGTKTLSGWLLNPQAKKLYVPSSLKSLRGLLGQKLDNIEEIAVDPANPHFDSRENCNAIIDSRKGALLLGGKNTKIPSSVSSFAQGAFAYDANLKDIVIPSNVLYIARGAFDLQRKYRSVTVDPANPYYKLADNARDILAIKNDPKGKVAISFMFEGDEDKEKPSYPDRREAIGTGYTLPTSMLPPSRGPAFDDLEIIGDDDLPF